MVAGSREQFFQNNTTEHGERTAAERLQALRERMGDLTIDQLRLPVRLLAHLHLLFVASPQTFNPESHLAEIRDLEEFLNQQDESSVEEAR